MRIIIRGEKRETGQLNVARVARYATCHAARSPVSAPRRGIAYEPITAPKKADRLCLFQLADKGISRIKTTKGFRPPFSKGGAVEAAEASSPVATGEISFSAFSFASFSLAPTPCKRKATKAFVAFDNLFFLKQGFSVA